MDDEWKGFGKVGGSPIDYSLYLLAKSKENYKKPLSAYLMLRSAFNPRICQNTSAEYY
jgi:hypothetical protein